jgi:hypothetical protein
LLRSVIANTAARRTGAPALPLHAQALRLRRRRQLPDGCRMAISARDVLPFTLARATLSSWLNRSKPAPRRSSPRTASAMSPSSTSSAPWGFPLLAVALTVGWLRVCPGLDFPCGIVAALPVALAGALAAHGLGRRAAAAGFTRLLDYDDR